MVATPPTIIKTAAIMLMARKISEMSRAMVLVAARERWDHESNQPCHTRKGIAIDEECAFLLYSDGVTHVKRGQCQRMGHQRYG